MSKRIAIIFDEKVYNQRGRFNAIRNRIKYLSLCSDYEINVFLVSTYDPWYIRFLRKTKKVERINKLIVDDIVYRVFWKKFSLIDYILEEKLHYKAIFSGLFYSRLENRIKGYQLISAHSAYCGDVAMRISQRDNIPFYVTWHGSDIHTLPFNNKSIFNTVKDILRNATCNFFVSEALCIRAKDIWPSFKYEILYNGINNRFFKYHEDKRKCLKNQYGIKDDQKVVAFVGDLIEIKNPQLLPLIFNQIYNNYSKPIVFWIIGNGKFLIELKESCRLLKIPVVFWGAQSPDDMPLYMNCIDVLVLPSKNEGLPLVTLEAIACGANAVGSDVGGIKEAVGQENVFTVDEKLVDNIARRVLQMLETRIIQPLDHKFSWEITAEKENKIYKQII